jgi:hypothetical protein
LLGMCCMTQLCCCNKTLQTEVFWHKTCRNARCVSSQFLWNSHAASSHFLALWLLYLC